jgi:hypothetical protein
VLAALDCRPKLGVVREPLDQRLVYAAFQALSVDRTRDIEQGSGRRGDRQPLSKPNVLLEQLASAVHPHAGAASTVARGRRDVDGSDGTGQQVPKSSGAEMTQHRARPTREQRAGLSGEWRRRCVTDEIDAAMETVESAFRHSVRHRPTTESGCPHLGVRRDPALGGSHRRDGGVARRADGHHSPDHGYADRPGPPLLSTMRSVLRFAPYASCRAIRSL